MLTQCHVRLCGPTTAAAATSRAHTRAVDALRDLDFPRIVVSVLDAMYAVARPSRKRARGAAPRAAVLSRAPACDATRRGLYVAAARRARTHGVSAGARRFVLCPLLD